MNVAVIGAGNMGRAISRRLFAGGHTVYLANIHPEKAQAVVEEIAGLGGPGKIKAVSTQDAVVSSEVIILSTWYAVTRQIASEIANAFGNRVIVDISNPLNETFDGLVTDPTTSAVEEIRSRAPSARWVKALNTAFAPLLFEGQLKGIPLDVFVASDDAEAKKLVFDLLKSSGLRAIDAGELKNSRTLERMALLLIEMQGRYGLDFRTAIKVTPVRNPLPLA